MVGVAVWTRHFHSYTPYPASLNTLYGVIGVLFVLVPVAVGIMMMVAPRLRKFARGAEHEWKAEVSAMMEADSAFWVTRPLTPLMCNYAAEDVRNLLAGRVCLAITYI